MSSNHRPEARPSDRDQILSDRDQTHSDSDQTLSDRDQTLSDRDQQASDADQAASDLDRADGHGSTSYERSAAVRVQGTHERLETGSLRDETARQRDAVAQERDEIAADRDRDARLHDVESGRLDQGDELFGKHTLHVQDIRSRATIARRRAANDRERARRDRELAARDRELAAEDREQAAHERRQAGTDELTGARRRGVGLEELQREIERARRTGGNLVAVYVDVDNLKAVNDGLGHRAGDDLLCEVADGLKRHVRSYDLVVRLGGDEFLCALPDVTLEDAHDRFDDLNVELHEGSSEGSVSVGFAALRDGESSDDLVHRADHELLAARGQQE
jgi:diguanylate cyclase (GGDEF)-like protein